MKKSLTIKATNFMAEKKHLNELLSNKDHEHGSLSRVKESWYFFDHKVTGEEMNHLVDQIQDHIIAFNEMDKEIVEEMKTVYKVIEALDKEYLKYIVAEMKSIETVQDELNETMDKQNKTVRVLSDFSEKLKRLEHIHDVDALWNKVLDIEEDATGLETNLTSMTKRISTEETKIKNLVLRTNQLEKKQAADSSDFKKQITKLEKDAKQISTTYSALSKRVKTEEDKTADLLASASQIKEQQANDVTSLKENIASLESQVAESSKRHDTLAERFKTEETKTAERFASLDSRASAAESTLTSLSARIAEEEKKSQDFAFSLHNLQEQNSALEATILEKIKILNWISAAALIVAIIALILPLAKGV